MDKIKLNQELKKQIEIRVWIKRSSPLCPKIKCPYQKHISS